MSALVRLATVTNYPIISVAFSNKFPFSLLQHSHSTVGQQLLCSRQLCPSRVFSFQDSVERTASTWEKLVSGGERRSHWAAETSDAGFCLGVVFVVPASTALVMARPMAKPRVTPRKHSKS